MNIAFLSSSNPNDQNNWSGTLYSLYTSLQKKHRVIWVGETVFAEVWEFHKANFKNNETFFPENYALLFGKLFSDLLKKECYDVIICRDYFFAAYLVSDIPLIYIGDTTFHLFNQYMNWQDKSSNQVLLSICHWLNIRYSQSPFLLFQTQQLLQLWLFIN